MSANYSTGYTPEQVREIYAAKIRRLAANGRAWLRAEGLKAREALNRVGYFEGWANDGTRAAIEGQLEDLRAAWKLAK